MNRFSLQKGAPLRKGVIRTAHGELSTPIFLPDATRASVRGISLGAARTVGVEAMVVNTYHLLLSPGREIIRAAGGAGKFMGWNGPLVSDSGGYQVYSLIHRNRQAGNITEEGAEFCSPIDGRRHLLTPERAIEIQFDLGVDMMVCLDDPRPNGAPEEEISLAVDRTVRWAVRCKNEYEKQCASRGHTEETRPLLLAVVQGGKSRELRLRCVNGLSEIGFDGYGFGARHIDEDGEFLNDIISYTASILPKESIRFALGIGTPEDIVRSYFAGWDVFDCVIPTREGRHGRLFLFEKQTGTQISSSRSQKYITINITNGRYKDDFSRVDEECDCALCVNHTRAYANHLFRVGDPLGAQLATLHNLRFYAKVIDRLRKKIVSYHP